MKNEKKRGKSSSQKRKRRNILIGCGMAAIIVVLGVTAGKLFVEKRQYEEEMQAEIETRGGNSEQTEAGRSVVYDGQNYEYNRKLTNILFMGVDKTDEVELQGTPGTAGQADCIMLLTLNEETQTCDIMQISRDSMTDVDIYDANGNYYTSVEAQIATQYAYGNGEKSSCWAMNKTVSELLFDLPIDAYISLNIDAISTLNDVVGGVTLNISEDYTVIDPAFVQGSTITLNGEQAERYVRYRDINVSGSNEGRMRRQVEYVTALIEAAKSAVGGENSYYERFSSYLMPYMVTDMDAKHIDSFTSYEFHPEETWYLPGEMKAGEEHDEFYVDEKKLREKLVKTFYKLAD